ncbi:MAG: transglycosylase SLT domain-containing protein [Gemmatimonadota bacterium]|jgi:membrane-bound lytic murein transglycosylase D
MSTIDLCGPQLAREYRSTPTFASSEARTGAPSKLRLALSLVLVPVVAWGWTMRPSGDDPVDTDAVVIPAVVGSRLPVHVNARVERWVQRFRTDQRAEFARLLERKGAYDQIIRRKLRERGMPQELLYLAMMESGLLPRAVSSASAVGLWQFMSPTAQQYGLRVDQWVDERRDPVRATNAALDYLAWLHDRYGSWYLAAAAYNAGPGTVDRVLHRHANGRTGDEKLYWEVLDYLPLETREYVPRMLAATILAEDARDEGFDVKADQPYRYDRVFVPGGTSLARVARSVGVKVRVLQTLNPHLIQGRTPPDETYPVRVPVGTSAKVVASLERVGRTHKADD